jgi:hypothetical protein
MNVRMNNSKMDLWIHQPEADTAGTSIWLISGHFYGLAVIRPVRAAAIVRKTGDLFSIMCSKTTRIATNTCHQPNRRLSLSIAFFQVAENRVIT